MKYQVESRIWISTEQGTVLGKGRVLLLKSIAETGSISKAAKSIGMSYNKAWKLVNAMNENAPFPYVETASGGKQGGGTVLTPHGYSAIEIYESILEEQMVINQTLSEKISE